MAELITDRTNSRNDQSSLSNPSKAVSTNIHLEWSLDFDKKLISGTCKHSITVLVTDTVTVDFDSSKLKISSVLINGESATFAIAAIDLQLGSKVSVTIPKELRAKGTQFEVLFKYCTDEDASAVKWLEPAATKGGKHPYVFTQSQAIHARSMFPCQDSPGVKTPYTATVRAPEWCTVLMSALADEVSGEPKGVFKWRQPVPTSAYLVALAAGHLDFRDISRRVRIWAEPAVVEQAAFDFSETEEFLQAAEALTCPYAWTRYDVLCMPPSFPYGGMENPCLTFVTPTLLTGDRSLADVIAHEIAHSWTGNLVTNSTWEHFWLNEGWTVWLERKIMAKVKGEEYLKLSAQIGWKHLKDDLALMGTESAFTSLVWPLGGEDPDEAFSSVPYEKGFNLLYRLEHLMGSEPFGCFAKAYIQKFKFSTATSADFRDFFVEFFTLIWDPLSSKDLSTSSWESEVGGEAEDESTKFVNISEATEAAGSTVVKYLTELLSAPSSPKRKDSADATRLREEAVQKLSTIQWAALLHSKGMPADPVPSFQNSLAQSAEALADRWIAFEGRVRGTEASVANKMTGGVKEELEGWSTQQVNLFLEFLLSHADEEKPFTETVLLALDGAYSFTKSGNAEIRFRWQSLCLHSDVAWIVPEVVAFITLQGRMKFVRPLYRALRQSKSGRTVAISTFKKFKNMYHPIARKMIEADLKKESEKSEETRAAPSALFSGTAVVLVAVASAVGFYLLRSRK